MEKTKKKALLVLTRVPYPETDGTRKRITEDIIKGISEDFSVDLLIVGDERLREESKEFLQRFSGNIFVFYKNKILLYLKSIKSILSGKPLQTEYYFDREVLKFINKKLSDYGVIYFHTLRLGKYLELMPKEYLSKVFLDLNDAISLNYQDAKKIAFFPWNLVYSFEEGRVRRYETKLLSLVKHANVVSDFDEKYLIKNCLKANVNIPNFYQIAPGVQIKDDLRKENNKNILFFGNIKYPPNKDAVLYFIKNIFPLLREKDEDVKLIIAGSGSDVIDTKNNPNITKLGFVDSLDKLFSDTSLVVAPIRFGAGVPTKILEALSYGVPVVTTPVGARGIKNNLVENIGIRIAEIDNHELWVKSILKILSYSDLRTKMSEESLAFIENNYAHSIIRSKYIKAFKLICNKL